MFDRIIYWKFYYSKVCNLMKPILVWGYIHFNGDQKKIGELLKNKTVLERDTLRKDLMNVKLSDYISGINFGKEKYFHIKSREVYVVPKGNLKKLKGHGRWRMLKNKIYKDHH